MHGHTLADHATIFQAIQSSLSANDEHVASSRLWDRVYSIYYQSAPEEEVTSTASDSEAAEDTANRVVIFSDPLQEITPLDVSKLNVNSPFSSEDHSGSTETVMREDDPCILMLSVLKFLHCVVCPKGLGSSSAIGASVHVYPTESFLNPKLTAKLMRQLQDPLTICSGSLPSWCEFLSLHAPFLFPYDCRSLFFYTTSFGIGRALHTLHQRLKDSGLFKPEEIQVGRFPRQKVRVSRDRILESAVKVMSLFAPQKAILEVEYRDESGTGLGPTLEFYSLVSTEIQRKKLNMWMDENHPYSVHVS